MGTEIMRSLVALMAIALLLNACSSLSEKSNSPLQGSNTTILGQTLPGLSDLDTETKADKEDAKWWSGYYGNKSTE